VVTLTVNDYQSWRKLARSLLAEEVPPRAVTWLDAAGPPMLPFSLEPRPDTAAAGSRPRVPRAFVAISEVVACHRSPTKWDPLYRVLWRLTRESPHLLDVESDQDVRAIKDMAAQVHRDEHKMRAFVRFAPVPDPSGTRYVSWYEPDHLIVARAAPFFADRFASMNWSILTPDLSAHWDAKQLTFSEGVPRPMALATGAIEELWRAYYEAVFNPARANLRATLREMPSRRWHRLPEAALIPRLLSTAHERTTALAAMRSAKDARPFVPDTEDLEGLRRAASSCRGCHLHRAATQTVFGEGPRDAPLVLVGEQPGDKEDIEGRPFVGPAGQVLDSALAAAGIDRREVYLTNAVKHFSFEPRGKRRIHQTPRLSEIQACRPWLEAEFRQIQPSTVVCLGSTAARALIGPQARVMSLRGRVLDGLAWAPRVLVTIHPSAVLRSGEEGPRYFDMLVSDLALARTAAGQLDHAR
jgi:DNA polymerase